MAGRQSTADALKWGPAVIDHLRTGEPVWFNQANLFHMSNLQPEVRRELLAEFGEAGLPRNAFYGDGSRIDDDDLDTVRARTHNRWSSCSGGRLPCCRTTSASRMVGSHFRATDGWSWGWPSLDAPSRQI